MIIPSPPKWRCKIKSNRDSFDHSLSLLLHVAKVEFFNGLDYYCFYLPSERGKKNPVHFPNGNQRSGGHIRKNGITVIQSQRASFPELLGPSGALAPIPGGGLLVLKALKGLPCLVALSCLPFMMRQLLSTNLPPEPRYTAPLCWGCP